MSGTGYEDGFQRGLADKQREEYHQGYKEAFHGDEGQRKKGLGEKAKEAVGLDPKDGRDPKDIGYEQGYNQSTTGTSGGGYGQSGYQNTTSYESGVQQQRTERTGSSSSDEETCAARGGEPHRKKGLGEKLKEKVGLDKKDGHGDPKDAAFDNNNQSGTYNQSGTTGYNNNQSGTGYNQNSTTGYDQSGTGTGYYNNQSGTGASYGNQSGTTGYEQQQGVSTGYDQQQQGVSGTTGYEQASSYGQQQQGGGYGGQGVTGGTYTGDERDSQGKKPLKQKLKEKLGMEPKNDSSYDNTQQTTTTEGRADYY